MENFGNLAWEYGLRPVGNLLPAHGERGKQNRNALAHALRRVLKAEGYAHRGKLMRSLNDALFSKVDHTYLRTEKSFNNMMEITVGEMPDVHIITLEDAIRTAHCINDTTPLVVRGESPVSTIYYRTWRPLREHLRNDFERAYEFRKKQ